MKRILLPMLLMGLLSGCETLGLGGGEKAAIEDRTAAEKKAPTEAAKGTETTGLAGSGLNGKTIEAGKPSMDPRKDPANPLSNRSVYFDFDKFEVKDEYRPLIEAHAAYAAAHHSARVIIQGNADERGSREYNLALGQKRADAVRKSLNVLGVQDNQMEAISFGEEKPRRTGTTEEDYAENRRADIVYGDE